MNQPESKPPSLKNKKKNNKKKILSFYVEDWRKNKKTLNFEWEKHPFFYLTKFCNLTTLFVESTIRDQSLCYILLNITVCYIIRFR